MVVVVDAKTKSEIEQIAGVYNLNVIYFEELGTRYGAESVKSKRLVRIRSNIDSDDFEYQFKQLQQNYKVELNQDMFVFNLFHEIGHFKLNLWPKRYGTSPAEKIMSRLNNLEIDKDVNIWAFEKFCEWKVTKNKQK